MQRGIPGRIGQATERGVSAGQGSYLIGAPTAMQDKFIRLLGTVPFSLFARILVFGLGCICIPPPH